MLDCYSDRGGSKEGHTCGARSPLPPSADLSYLGIGTCGKRQLTRAYQGTLAVIAL